MGPVAVMGTTRPESAVGLAVFATTDTVASIATKRSTRSTHPPADISALSIRAFARRCPYRASSGTGAASVGSATGVRAVLASRVQRRACMGAHVSTKMYAAAFLALLAGHAKWTADATATEYAMRKGPAACATKVGDWVLRACVSGHATALEISRVVGPGLVLVLDASTAHASAGSAIAGLVTQESGATRLPLGPATSPPSG